VIASRKLEACEEVAREVEQLGPRALPVAAHVGQWEDNDFAPKVRVNCIAPGPFLTDVSTVWRENETYEQSLGLKRFGRPEEIVGTALYLASDASSYVTGQVIRVDGGTW
jgi:enoyl-[acyl-carrier-protein] reductase (NADH)